MFLKKILLLTINILFLTGLSASDFSVKIEKIDENNVSLEFNTTNYLGENQDNWVGLFKKDATNVWANVRSWAWVKDLPLYPTQIVNSEARKFEFQGESDGEYEIRFFENNSYNPHTIQNILLDGANNQPFLRIISQHPYGYLTLGATSADKAWVGIFRKDEPSDREHLLDWKWVKNNKIDYFNTNALTSGIYEARLFFNNSYTLEAKVEFSLDQEAHVKIFEDIQPIYRGDGQVEVLLTEGERGTHGDWIGMFKSNTVPIIDNLVAYTLVPRGVRTSMNLITYQPELLNSGEYFLIYFIRNSYYANGQSGILNVELD